MSLIEDAKIVLEKTMQKIEEFQEDPSFNIMREAESIFSENYMDFQNLILHIPTGCVSILFKKRKTICIVKNKSTDIKCNSAQDIAIAICIIWLNACGNDHKQFEECELLNILLKYNEWVVCVDNSFHKYSNEKIECRLNLTGRYSLIEFPSLKYANSMKTRRYLISKQKSKITIYDIKKSQTVCAKCSKNDIYDPTLGVLIAWSRLKNICIPDFIFNVMDSDDLRHNDVFTYFGETEQHVVIATIFGRKTICASGNLGCCISYPIPQMKPLTLGRKVKLIMRNGVKIC